MRDYIYSHQSYKGIGRNHMPRKGIALVLALFILCALSWATNLNLWQEVKAEGRESILPEDAVGLFYHGFETSVKRAQSESYIAYEAGMPLEAGNEVMKYFNRNAKETNGIKTDVTDYIMLGSSGDTYGASIRIKGLGWNKPENRKNKAKLFFEIVHKNGKKTIYSLDSKGPNTSGSNLTNAKYPLGDNWLKEALSGQTKLNFSKTDKIYLCITLKNTDQWYDDISLYAYMNSQTNPKSVVCSTPDLDSKGENVSFQLENPTVEDKRIKIEIQSYEDNLLKKAEEYEVLLKAGTKKRAVTLPAKKGDVISIRDAEGPYYITSLKLGHQKWLATWASAQQALDPGRGEYPPAPGLANNTLRQIVRISKGGTKLRFQFSNEYGRTPLEIQSVHIAKPGGVGDSLIDMSSDRTLTFEGSEKVTLKPGEMITSDPIEFPAKDLERIAITTYFGEVPRTVTSHTGARTTAYLMRGNHVVDVSMPISTQFIHWYFISSIDVMANDNGKAIAILGDSITDGYGVTTDMDNRWTDIFATRLLDNPETSHITVLNQGIGGNSIFGGLGPAARSRFKRDVLDQEGVGYVILFTGVNDIGYANSADLTELMIRSYIDFAEKAHEKGIKVYGGTITPFGGSSYYTPLREQIRRDINKWIRTNDYFDGVIDFDAGLRDPNKNSFLASQYNNDNLHPNLMGYKKIGELIDLSLFED